MTDNKNEHQIWSNYDLDYDEGKARKDEGEEYPELELGKEQGAVGVEGEDPAQIIQEHLNSVRHGFSSCC